MNHPASPALDLLWAKTKRDGAPTVELWHPLRAHMWDSAAVAGWLWDNWLPRSVRDLLGGGTESRSLYRWLSGLHDLGKASVAFQTKAPELAAKVDAAGLPCGRAPTRPGEAPHGLVSGIALVDSLTRRGWPVQEAEWLGLIVGGHHGKFPAVDWLDPKRSPGRQLLGDESWSAAREALFVAVTESLGCQLDRWRGRAIPVPAQLVLTGAVILADWLASNDGLFPYAGAALDGYRDGLDDKAARIAETVGLRGIWRPDPGLAIADPDTFCDKRFGWSTRPVQRLAVDMASRATGPGLLLIEAPTGEGKTEAALLAAEVLAARHGQGGVFVGLPTQATANQMFSRVRRWLATSDQTSTIALAHGKSRRVEEYRRLLRITSVEADAEGGPSAGTVVAAQWFTRKKALLAPVVVGTVDQLLLAGVAAHHVVLRHLGLAGKVVVVDEVHAYDAYMSTLLRRVLAWLGAMRVPVILLSATLPGHLRRALLAAYAGREVCDPPAGYPQAVWVDAPDGLPVTRSAEDILTARAQPVPDPVQPRAISIAASSPRRARVSMVAERDTTDDATAPSLAADLVSDGGCVVVLRNTVGRAQHTYRALVERLGEQDVTLFHARFTVADRRRLEDRLVSEFGRDGRRRPRRRVVVATQVVEQSLDVDFDALITDLAPIDLLLQRLGRVHRHHRADHERPSRLASPAMYVVGQEPRPDAPPRLPAGTGIIYGRCLPWRAAAVLHGRSVLDIPGDVADLIEHGYGDGPVGPTEWQRALAHARTELEAQVAQHEAQAEVMALPAPDRAEALSRVHHQDVGREVDESTPVVQAHVRLGPPTIEVLLLRATPDGHAVTASSERERVPLDRLPSPDLFDLLLDQAIRPPAQVTKRVSEAARLPEAWQKTPWLARTPVLLLPADGGPLRLDGFNLHYQTNTGLEVSRAR